MRAGSRVSTRTSCHLDPACPRHGSALQSVVEESPPRANRRRQGFPAPNPGQSGAFARETVPSGTLRVHLYALCAGGAGCREDDCLTVKRKDCEGERAVQALLSRVCASDLTSPDPLGAVVLPSNVKKRNLRAYSSWPIRFQAPYPGVDSSVDVRSIDACGCQPGHPRYAGPFEKTTTADECIGHSCPPPSFVPTGLQPHTEDLRKKPTLGRSGCQW
jgi:hypothetical protein